MVNKKIRKQLRSNARKTNLEFSNNNKLTKPIQHMKPNILHPAFGIMVIIFFYACAGSNTGNAVKEESLKIKIREEKNIVTADRLKPQRIFTMDERMMAANIGSRGLLGSTAGGLVSLATDAVKKMIAKEKKKYVASYDFGLTDLYFYDQLSLESPFDPVGLQFGGFKITRTFKNNEGKTDTAMSASFVLDTVNNAEMINNSVFRLRLKDIQLHFAKAKIENPSDKLNMDFEITFFTSYVNNEGTLFDNVVLGKFYFFLRNAPLGPRTAITDAYYNNLKDSLLSGKSFIIPRSFGYHRDPDGAIKGGYSQGAYSITVKVTESSKEHFVSKIISDNADMIIEATGNKIKGKVSQF